MALLRRQGIRTIIFLDDLLVMGQSKEEMVSQVEEILHFFQLLGFVINQEKSVLSPSHTIQFLGFIVDSALMVISLPQKKVVDITKACQAALLQGTLSVRDLSRLIGQMSATMRAVLPGPLCYRKLQRIKNQELSRSHSFESMVTLDDSAKEELLWWVHQVTTWNGRAIISQTPDLVVETDASLLGWGAVSGEVRTGGLWSEKERTQHINCLELMAGALAVRTFAKHKRNIHVRLRMDNKTAIFYINRMRGTRSQSMVQPACQLWQWCLQRGITYSAEYLPGAKNERADEESRTMQSSAEWMLNAQVFKCIMQVMGVDGRCIGSENICKAQKEYPCTITNGQQNGNLLHKPYEGNPIPEHGAASLSAMAVVSPEGDNLFSRVFTRGKERESRRRITNHAIFSRMDAECSSVQMHNAGDGSMPDRLVCNTSQSSVRPLRELAARSICHGNRCLPDYLEELSGVRISTLCPSWQVSSKDSSGGKHGGPSGPSVGDTMVVSIPPPAPNRLSSVTPSSPGPSERSIREKAPPIASTSAAVGRLECLRGQHLAAGLSERSSKLIRAGRSGSTNTTYNLVGKGGIAGVSRGKLIPFRVTSNHFWTF